MIPAIFESEMHPFHPYRRPDSQLSSARTRIVHRPKKPEPKDDQEPSSAVDSASSGSLELESMPPLAEEITPSGLPIGLCAVPNSVCVSVVQRLPVLNFL